MRNRPGRLPVISGLPVTGVMVMMSGIIIGCRAPGLHRRQWAYFGPRRGGAGTTARTRVTTAIGGRVTDFVEALTTAMAPPETATGADDGVETPSSTTPLSRA